MDFLKNKVIFSSLNFYIVEEINKRIKNADEHELPPFILCYIGKSFTRVSLKLDNLQPLIEFLNGLNSDLIRRAPHYKINDIVLAIIVFGHFESGCSDEVC